MTKYADIADKAIAYAAAFMNQRFMCERVAHLIKAKIRNHLEAPGEAIQFVELDEKLETVWTPLHEPKVTQGSDGFWYFGLLLSFQATGKPAYSKLSLRFGCRTTADRATIKLERTYDIELKDEAAWLPLLTELERDLLAHYSSSPTEPARPIGFLSVR